MHIAQFMEVFSELMKIRVKYGNIGVPLMVSKIV